jgi:hypothetical protein
MNENMIKEAYQGLSRSVTVSPKARALIDHAVVVRRRRDIAAAGIGVGCATLALGGVAFATIHGNDATPAATSAAPSSSPSESVSLPGTQNPAFQWQMEIDGYESELLDAASSFANYSGARLDFDTRSLTVYGVGDAPGPVKEIMDQAPEGLVVKWVAVPYSEQELAQAVNDAMKAVPGAHSATFEQDYSGVVVIVEKLPASAEKRVQLERAAERAASVPVRIIEGPAFTDPVGIVELPDSTGLGGDR